MAWLDPASLLAAFFVFVGNLLLIIYYVVENNREHWDQNAYAQLEPEFLLKDWAWRRENRQLDVSGKMMSAISWVFLTAPILQVCVVLSKGGERLLALHVTIVSIAMGAAITEIAAQLMHLGAFNAADWASVEFQLNDWMSEGSGDSIGWQALEISYREAAGLTLWVDSVEYLALSVIFILIFISANTMGDYAQNIGLGLSGFALFIGLLSIADFACYVARFKFWATASIVGRIVAVMNRLIFIPIWLLALSCRLPACTDAHRQEEITDGSNVPSLADMDAAFT